MKFSDITEQDWPELQPYLDTCLLPLTGMSGQEAPWQVTEQLRTLRDAMDHIEIPFKGRVVTYPSIQYQFGSIDEVANAVDHLASVMKKNQFRYVILVSCVRLVERVAFTQVDAVFDPTVLGEADAGTIVAKQLQQLWNKKSAKDPT